MNRLDNSVESGSANILANKKIILGVGGGIAAYKACEIVRALRKAQAEVRVVLTKAAQEFVAPLTLQSLSEQEVHTDLFSLSQESKMSHIELADQADLILIAPATADLMAKLNWGVADQLLTTLVLATQAPIVLAPAMNVNMWQNAQTQRNLDKLSQNFFVVPPESGELACGWEGQGRLAALDSIMAVCRRALYRSMQQDLFKGKKVVINAGPTREAIDPIRYLSNSSTGKMGYALAEAAWILGAEVTLISGPAALLKPYGVESVEVETAQEMCEASLEAFEGCDLFIASAAVADYRPLQCSDQKLKKKDKSLSLELERTPDILFELGQQKKKQLLVGFAAETENLQKNALSKLSRKNLDAVVANSVSVDNPAFGSDMNAVTLYFATKEAVVLQSALKQELAFEILNLIGRNC